MSRIGFVDGTLCAAQYSIWKDAISRDLVMSCVGRLDGAGFDALDVIDGPLFDHCVLSGENPWRWVQSVAGLAKRTSLNAWISTTTFLGTTPLSFELVSTGVACLAKNGITRVTCYDPFNDPVRLKRVADVVRDAGLRCSAALVFSDTHDGAAALPGVVGDIAGKFDSVCLWDAAGAMSPEIGRSLVPALCEAATTTDVELRVHCQSGRAEIVCLDALDAGIRFLHTSVDALAGGPSLPSFEYFAAQLSRGTAQVDAEMAAGMSEHIAGYADRHGLQIGRHQLGDLEASRFEVPPDLLPQIDSVVAGGIDRQELLEECRRIRKNAGGLSMVRPGGALILREAVSNLDGNDAGIPARAGGTIEPACQASIDGLRAYAATGSADVTSSGGAADPAENAETLVLAAMLGPSRAETLLAGGSSSRLAPVRADTPLLLLMDELARRPEIRRLSLAKGDWRFELGS